MKKFIALLLALVMAFSVTVVAFAADENTDDGTGTEETTPSGGLTFGNLEMTEEEIIEFVMNLPVGVAFHGAKMILKVAKIAIKIALVLDKVHIIDLSPVKNAIFEWVADMIEDFVKGQQPEDPETPETPEVPEAA